MTDKKSLIELLHDLMAKEFQLPIKERKLCITETKSQATCRWVEIRMKQSVPSFCLTIDKPRKKGENDPIFPFFNPEETGICSKNDAILICQKWQKHYVFLIELKSKNPGDYLKQLKAAQTFVQFIFARIKLYELCKYSLKDLEFRGILFSCRHCRKTPDDGTSKHKKIEQKEIVFNDRNGLLVTEQECNQSYNLTEFLK